MTKKDVRWVQRFQNFEKAFFKLKEALEKDRLNELERNGVVQRFEFTLELCWNVMKDYMQEQGLEFQLTPKGTFRQAQKSGLIDFGEVLIDALEVRNVLSHDYNEDEFEIAEGKIREEIFPAIEKVYSFFAGQLSKQIKLL
ncbi:MAG: HI0074 family nucleotidyltransferase substrate-binding subunit [Bacteroidota bacterium]